MVVRVAGATGGGVIRRRLLPSFLSYVIVHLTLAVPNMIFGQTALSLIGLGLKPPVVSWGVLLSTAQNFRTVALSLYDASRPAIRADSLMAVHSETIMSTTAAIFVKS